MSQTATILSGGHNYTTLTFSTQAENRNSLSQNEAGIPKLINWFGDVQFINALQYTVLPAGKLHYKDRLVLKFSLRADYDSHFILLKGLFEFGKSSSLFITANRTDKTFTVEVSAEQAEGSIAYFKNVINWFSREIKFKAALKQVIAWEQKVRGEQQAIIDNLYASL
jgi:hypothetical protein